MTGRLRHAVPAGDPQAERDGVLRRPSVLTLSAQRGVDRFALGCQARGSQGSSALPLSGCVADPALSAVGTYPSALRGVLVPRVAGCSARGLPSLVLSLGDWVEMPRVAAPDHAAQVIQHQALRDRSVVVFPDSSVGQHVNSVPASRTDLAVARGADRSGPNPTVSVGNHLGHDAVNDGCSGVDSWHVRSLTRHALFTAVRDGGVPDPLSKRSRS
jgi:hypothetical protein